MTLTFYRDYQELFNGCVAYYNLSSNGIIGSSVINLINPSNYNGTISGANLTGTDRFGKANNAMKFPDSEDKITGVYLLPSTFTIFGWVNPVNQSGLGIVYREQDATRIGIYISQSQLYVQVYNGSTWLNTYINISYTTWECFAVTVTGSTLILYSLSTNQSISGSYTISATPSPMGASIGNSPHVIDESRLNNGSVEELIFYNTVLSAPMLKTLYNLTKNKYLYPVQAGIRGVE